MLKFQKGQKMPTSKIELVIQDNWVCLTIWGRDGLQMRWGCFIYMLTGIMLYLLKGTNNNNEMIVGIS